MEQHTSPGRYGATPAAERGAMARVDSVFLCLFICSGLRHHVSPSRPARRRSWTSRPERTVLRATPGGSRRSSWSITPTSSRVCSLTWARSSWVRVQRRCALLPRPQRFPALSFVFQDPSQRTSSPNPSCPYQSFPTFGRCCHTPLLCSMSRRRAPQPARTHTHSLILLFL